MTFLLKNDLKYVACDQALTTQRCKRRSNEGWAGPFPAALPLVLPRGANESSLVIYSLLLNVSSYFSNWNFYLGGELCQTHACFGFQKPRLWLQTLPRPSKQEIWKKLTQKRKRKDANRLNRTEVSVKFCFPFNPLTPAVTEKVSLA